MMPRSKTRAVALAGLLLIAALAMPAAQAAGRFCISADTLLFGNVALGMAPAQSASVVNCGDEPWSFTDVSVHPATGAAFGVTTDCRTGLVLGPEQRCEVGVRFAPRASGETSGGLWLRNTTSTPAQLLTFYGRGIDASAGSTSLSFLPATVEFDPQRVGTESGPISVELRNAGPVALTPTAIVLNGPSVSDFRGDLGSCAIGVAIPAGGNCRVNLYFRPQEEGARQANLVVDARELATLAILHIAGTGATLGSDALAVVEFFNAALTHYFITASADEAAAIERGDVGPGWERTGKGFRAWALEGPAPASASPVCRFFGTPGLGASSHFFTANPDECAPLRQNPYWLYEGLAFRTMLAGTSFGGCPSGTDPVLRFFWPGADVTEMRHRFVLDEVVAQRMRDAHWVEEGAVFCSPR